MSIACVAEFPYTYARLAARRGQGLDQGAEGLRTTDTNDIR